MTLTYTREFTVKFDLEEAIDSFNFYVDYLGREDYDTLVYDVIGIHLTEDANDSLYIPHEIIEKCADMLRMRIGGVQMKMDCLEEE